MINIIPDPDKPSGEIQIWLDQEMESDGKLLGYGPPNRAFQQARRELQDAAKQLERKWNDEIKRK
jgi:hypothetical protein